MLTDFIVGLFTICLRVVTEIVRSVFAIVMHLLGPGVIVALLACAAAAWWFGWFSF